MLFDSPGEALTPSTTTNIQIGEIRRTGGEEAYLVYQVISIERNTVYAEIIKAVGMYPYGQPVGGVGTLISMPISSWLKLKPVETQNLSTSLRTQVSDIL